MNTIAKALYMVAMNQDDEKTEIIEGDLAEAKAESKLVENCISSDRTYYKTVEKIFRISTVTMANTIKMLVYVQPIQWQRIFKK